ncbi:uncharacterized protein LOC144749714 isoform X2 [Ciona intestinalis]
MDSVVEKASNLLDALEVSTTSKVKQFDERRLKRAFEWTNYFKKVYESVSQNPKTVEKLNARLKTLALSRNKELPEDYFTFNTFRDGEQILYKFCFRIFSPTLIFQPYYYLYCQQNPLKLIFLLRKHFLRQQ